MQGSINKWHVVDVDTGEILFENENQMVCVQVVFAIKKLLDDKLKYNLWVL